MSQGLLGKGTLGRCVSDACLLKCSRRADNVCADTMHSFKRGRSTRRSTCSVRTGASSLASSRRLGRVHDGKPTIPRRMAASSSVRTARNRLAYLMVDQNIPAKRAWSSGDPCKRTRHTLGTLMPHLSSSEACHSVLNAVSHTSTVVGVRTFNVDDASTAFAANAPLRGLALRENMQSGSWLIQSVADFEWRIPTSITATEKHTESLRQMFRRVIGRVEQRGGRRKRTWMPARIY